MNREPLSPSPATTDAAGPEPSQAMPASAGQPAAPLEAELPDIEFESPGRFPVNNPQARVSAELHCEPAPFELGSEPQLQRFEQPEQARAHALALIGQARRSLCIYSNDLEPWLYHQAAIQQACTRFLLASPGNRLRILLADPSRVVRDGHRLLNLARRLPSNCHIRKLHPDYPIEPETFMLADRHGLLLRSEPEHYSGIVLYNDAGRVKLRQAQFDQAWDLSLTDPDLRSLLL